MNAKEFEAKTGREPQDDDLERANCRHGGHVGHFHCGWCTEHDSPVFECGCILMPDAG